MTNYTKEDAFFERLAGYAATVKIFLQTLYTEAVQGLKSFDLITGILIALAFACFVWFLLLADNNDVIHLQFGLGFEVNQK